MLSMKEFMELVDYRITEGDTYGWQCFGPNSYQLSSWNGVHGTGGWSANIVFSTRSQKVYEVSVCDYTRDRAYRMINPDYVKKHDKEAQRRDVSLNEAWDAVNYVDLETDDDFVQKFQAIVAGQEYDTRVQVPVDFTDEELLKYMKAAHELDISFNEFVVQAITQAVQAYQADPKAFGQRYNY